MCGSLWYNPYSRETARTSKYEGRRFDAQGFRKALLGFVSDGRKLRRDVVKDILRQVKELRSVVSRMESFRFYSR